MSKLKIFTFPDTVLKQKALPIDRIDKSLYKVADDMLETMYDAPGVGLAANQVGILQRILVLDTDYSHEEPLADMGPEDENSKFSHAGEAGTPAVILNKNPKIIINPEIIRQEGSITWCEGCLSVPDYQAEVKRAAKITLQYQDMDGLTTTLDAEGLQAVCIQHEIDHLNGKLFIERLSPLKKEMIQKKLAKERAERDRDDG